MFNQWNKDPDDHASPQFSNFETPQQGFFVPPNVASAMQGSFPRAPSPFLLGAFSFQGYARSPSSSSSSPGPAQQEKPPSRTRVEWSRNETSVLIQVWGSKYQRIKCASSAQKKVIWNQIRELHAQQCTDMHISSMKSLDQLKKRIKNLEYEYRQIRTKMASTEEEGATKCKGNLVFFDELDEILGSRDAMNPGLMPVESSIIGPAADTPGTDAAVGHDRDTSIEEQGSQAETLSREKARRRKRKATPELAEEDPHMKVICDMWRTSMEKQNERFERSMQLQQAAIQSQTEQTKALVSGLKDILKDCRTHRT